MKPISILSVILLCSISVQAEIVTLTLDASVTNRSDTIAISSQQTLTIRNARLTAQCATQNGTQPKMVLTVNGIPFTNAVSDVNLPISSGGFLGFAVAGPATLFMLSDQCGGQNLLTCEIQPSAFPPDKALTLGAFSGNVKVTMEDSTDLVNWTPANNGATYTNAPAARFFRIKMEKNAPPPP